MKKLCSLILSAAITVSVLPSAVLAQNEDYTDTLTYSAYGGDGVWWNHSDAEVTQNEDGSITIKNVDNNSSYSAVDVANAALGGEYVDYTADDYASLFDNGTDVQTLVRNALSANEADGKRTLGKTNHGLFSNKIAVNTQSTEIKFTAKFNETGAFVEISNNNCYAPYINTDNGNITVNTGYANDVLIENFDTDKWYTFKIVLHDGRTENPVASGSVTVYDADDESAALGTIDGLKLHYTDVSWYKVNFFPNSKYGAQMQLKDFTVAPYGGDTPEATPAPDKTPYPTLEPTPSPTPRPDGAPTPKPTLNSQPAEGAKSKNIYTFTEDFEPYINQVGQESIKTDKFVNFDTVAKVYDDNSNNRFLTLTNAKTGTRYFATADEKTAAIETTAVVSMKVKFNTLKAHNNGNVAVFDLTSSNAHNKKSSDEKLVIAEKISVDCAGKMTADSNEICTVSTGKWYTVKSVSDVKNKTNSIYVYDENGTLAGKVENIAFYDSAATAVKNIRFDLCRGSGSYSIDDIYMYELKDTSLNIFDDVNENNSPLINYFAALGIVGQSVKITAVYNADKSLKNVYFDIDDEIQAKNGETVKTFVWDSMSGMRPVSETSFDGGSAVSAVEINNMITLATETKSMLSGDVTREKLYAYLVEIYKTRSGDDEPVQGELTFTDKDSINTDYTAAIGTAVKLGLTPVKNGAFNPTSSVSRYEAAQAVSRLISAINVGITDKIISEPEEEIIIPHVIDQLPETGVMRDPMVENAPDGYYYMCCSTGTHPDNAKGKAFPRSDISDESLWKDDTGVRIWRSSDLVDWTPVKSAKEDSEYPYYIWNVYEGGTWEKVNGFGVKNINIDGTNGTLGAKRFAQVLWAPEIHWIKGTYFIVYCMNPGGTSIARSVSGKPEGPYVRQECSQDTQFRTRIDASLFWDDDNEVYYTDGSCAIFHMNEDMTGIVKKSNGNEEFISAQAPGKEGGFLFKRNGIYYATAGEFDEQGGYDAVVGMNKTGKCMANGEYKEVHWLYTLGHNGYFEDKEGNWWATMFGNDNDKLANETNGFNNGFALVPIDFDKYTGKIIIDTVRLDEWNNLLISKGYSFAK